MKKAVFFLTLLLAVLLVPRFASATEESIKDFNSQININKDGTIGVTEKIIYDFDNNQKHGIYRYIPEIKTNSQGKKFRMDFSGISVADENGQPYLFTLTNSGDKINLKIGDANRTITGIHTYFIRYKVAGALTYFSDHDELYWNVTGNDWTVPILHSGQEVILPTEISQNEIKTVCYVGPVGSTETGCQSRPLSSGEGVTIAVSFPKNIVAVLEPKEVVLFFSTLLGKIVIVLLIILAILWYIVYPLWIPVKWWKYGRDPKTDGPVRAWFDPPKTVSGRFLTAIETGSLVDESVDMKDISAMIVQLAQKGYLKIVEKKKGEFSFVHRSQDEGGLLDFEKEFLKGIFGNKKQINLEDEEFYEPVKKLGDDLYKNLVRENFFVKNPNSVRNFYAFVLGAAAFTFNLPLLFSTLIFGRIMPRKTMFGAQTANVGRSLKNFLSSQERQLEFQAKNQMFFEKLLPFAVAFGVEKVWANRFKNIKMTPPDWYQGYGRGNFNSVIFVSYINSSFSSFRSAATPPTSSSGFSSGFSGGSSGGGGGGGGGGSW